MDSGAARRASATSAFRSIKYWVTGAMFGYGVLASCACARDTAPSMVSSAKTMGAIVLQGLSIAVSLPEKILLPSKNQDLIEDAIGHVELAHLWQSNFAAIAQVHGDDVGVRVEASAFLRHVIGDDHVRALALELAARIFSHAIGFGGEPNQDAAVVRVLRRAAEFCENIGRGLEIERDTAFAFHFLVV